MREHQSYIPGEVNRQFIPNPDRPKKPERKILTVEELQQTLTEVESQPVLSDGDVRQKLNDLGRAVGAKMIAEGQDASWENKSKEKERIYDQIVENIIRRLAEELGDTGDFKLYRLGLDLLKKEEGIITKLVKKCFSVLPEKAKRAIAKKLEEPFGSYSSTEEKIRLSSNADESARKMLFSLAIKGYSNKANALRHETIHHLQAKAQNTKLYLLKFYAKLGTLMVLNHTIAPGAGFFGLSGL